MVENGECLLLLQSVPQLREAINLTQKLDLFIRKCQLCHFIYDSKTLATPNILVASNRKLEELTDILEYLHHRDDILTSETVPYIIKMVAINIFHARPAFDSTIDYEEDEVVHPDWPSLKLVFGIFLRVCASQKVDAGLLKKHITSSFIIQFLELFKGEDQNCRDYLKTILHSIYARCMSLRCFIRKSMHHVIYSFVYDEYNPYHPGISEVLEIQGK